MMVRLAKSAGEPLSVKTMSDHDDVPYQFARAIQRDLATAGLIKVVRGARGGAVLARSAEEIHLLEIVLATQGHPHSSVCVLDDEWCDRMGGCAVHQVWAQLDSITEDFLRERKLSSLTTVTSAINCGL